MPRTSPTSSLQLVEQAIVVEARAADEDPHTHSQQHPEAEHGLRSCTRQFHPFGIKAYGIRLDLLSFQGVNEAVEHVEAELPVCLADAAQPFLSYQHDDFLHSQTPKSQSRSNMLTDSATFEVEKGIFRFSSRQ